MAKLITKNLQKLIEPAKLPFGLRYINNEATLQTKPFKLHRMESGPNTDVVLTRTEALQMYKEMLTIRRFENAANILYKEKFIRGFLHLYTGQEAVCVGLQHALKKGDPVITSYRCHGWTYCRGVSVSGILSELMGRKTGCANGKGGSMHMYGRNYYGGNGIVGGQVSLGAGIALGLKYKELDNVCLTLYGDGAANQGQVFESFNMAKLWSLPVVFICENNGYGMGTPTERSSASTDYYKRGDIVPGLWADGMDVLSMKEATRFLTQLCREGKGPFVMEAATYRYVGHSMSDPGTSYRTREEVKEVRTSRDPISHFKSKIVDANLVTVDEIKQIDIEVKKMVDEAVRQSKTDEPPTADELAADIYCEPIESEVRGVSMFKKHLHKRVGEAVNLH